MTSANIKGHMNKIVESYSSILRMSVSHSNYIYDESILEKCITCIEHIFKATYILKFKDDIDFDKIDYNKFRDYLLTTFLENRDDLKKMSLNKMLGYLLNTQNYMSREYYDIYCAINPERNKVTH